MFAQPRSAQCAAYRRSSLPERHCWPAAIACVVFGSKASIYAAVSSAIGIYLSEPCLARHGADPLQGAAAEPAAEMPELHDLMRNSRPMPSSPGRAQLYYVPSKMLNAFAVGNREDRAVAVTDGLLRAMTLRQLGRHPGA